MLVKYVELQIIQNGMNGEGIAKADGKVFFVDGAIAGDVVIAEIVKENKNFTIAKLKEIVKSSQYRSEPICPYYGKCGGCNLQHIDYKKQLEIKTQNIQNLFDKTKLNFKVNDCISSQQEYSYRNKITMYLGQDNRLSFYQKGSKCLVNINNCYLVNEKFNDFIAKMNVFFEKNKEFNYFVVRGMAVRLINDIFIINLILNKKVVLTKLENWLKLNKIKYSLYYCVNNKNNLPTYPCIFVGGEKNVFVREFDIKYGIEPMSFLQVNNSVKTNIYQIICNKVSTCNNVLDAYSGAGLLSAILAKKCKHVFAVEIDKSACLACEQLCKLNGIKNLECICGDCSLEVPKIVSTNMLDCVILDPARKGVDDKTLESVKNSLAKDIIYLSCNPATLTRDLKILCEDSEYQITYVQPFDMFPQTSEVETLVFLSKK